MPTQICKLALVSGITDPGYNSSLVTNHFFLMAFAAASDEALPSEWPSRWASE